VALAGGPLVLWLYRRTHRYRHAKAPSAFATAIATLHCGAGCTLGDIIAESLALAFPSLLIWFGLGSLFVDRLFASWVLDFILAYLIGIVFQYFSIAPMRHLRFWPSLAAAIKADTLSLIAWQIGMYGVMAAIQFGWRRLMPDSAPFWFAMQIAMLGGFAVSYPVNAMLLSTGIKEKM
jgi:Domain of unknown function (DUF4396)